MEKVKSKNKKTLGDKYLPPEILTQILARLPVATLLKFRSVCKSWRSIIDHSDFIAMHLKLSSNNRHKNRLFVVEGFGHGGFKGCIFTIRRADTLRKCVQLVKTPPGVFKLLGGHDGLFLLESQGGGVHKLRLWNPSIRKCLLLPVCPVASVITYKNFILGFSTLSNDYKVVGIQRTDGFSLPGHGRGEVCIAVYTLSDNLWRVSFHNGIKIPTERFEGLNEGFVFFRGAAHWIENDQNYKYTIPFCYQKTHLVSFNFDVETFSYLELPDAGAEVPTIRCLFLLGESLALFCVSAVSRRIWVLEKDGAKDSWSLWFSGDSSESVLGSFLSQYDNSHRSRSMLKIFCVGSSGTSFLYGKNLYNISDHGEQSLAKTMSDYFSSDTYLESLVLSKGYEDRNLTPFPLKTAFG